MEINLENLIPFEILKSDLDTALKVVDEKGQIVILKDNQPTYIITRYKAGSSLPETYTQRKSSTYTLQEAMKIVLQEQKEKNMHAADIADEIYRRGLYYKKDGGKAQYNQIRARASHYPQMFEALKGNVIKLKENV
jgi:antitoxin Phd